MPRDVSFGWLAQQESFDFFDVLHIHSIELAADDDIDAVLDRCKVGGKQVISTIHDVYPMFNADQDGYAATLRKLTSREVTLVILTAGAAKVLTETLDLKNPPLVLPHGYVLDPDDDRHAGAAQHFRNAMYGGFRPNRVRYPVVANILFGTEPSSRLAVLTRALSPIELRAVPDARETIVAALARPDRVELRLRPFPDDDEIIGFLAGAHALVMPYLWGTHTRVSWSWRSTWASSRWSPTSVSSENSGSPTRTWYPSQCGSTGARGASTGSARACWMRSSRQEEPAHAATPARASEAGDGRSITKSSTPTVASTPGNLCRRRWSLVSLSGQSFADFSWSRCLP